MLYKTKAEVTGTFPVPTTLRPFHTHTHLYAHTSTETKENKIPKQIARHNIASGWERPLFALIRHSEIKIPNSLQGAAQKPTASSANKDDFENGTKNVVF